MTLPQLVVLWTLAPLVVGLAIGVGLRRRERGWNAALGWGSLAFLLLVAVSAARSILPVLSWEPLSVDAAAVVADRLGAAGPGPVAERPRGRA